MIEIVRLSRHYRMGPTTVKALDDVSVSIRAGEYVSIMGPSGSGKSTLMNIIGCLESPTSGTYTLSGQQIAGLSRNRLAEIRNRRIGFVFQNFNLLPRASAIENVELPLVYAGVPLRRRRERAQEVLKQVGLEGREKHHPAELSGGQRQRVAIARALATEPLILLADEPTGALDSKSAAQIMELFEALNQGGVAVVVVTHDPGVAEHARRIIRILDGQIVADETRERAA
jgi:putative ABC transport system ATP-binding protein